MLSDRFVQYVKGKSNLVLTVPHAASRIPKNVEHNLDLRRDEVRKTLKLGVDLCVPKVTGFRDYEKAARIWTTLPRVIIDVNRLPEHTDELAVKGAGKNYFGHGIIWRATAPSNIEDIKPTLIQPYTKNEFIQLLDAAYYPYVKAVKTALEEARSMHGIAIHFDLHSMTPTDHSYGTGIYQGTYVLGKRLAMGSQKDGKQPELLLLDRGESQCDKRISDKVMQIFTDYGILIEREYKRGTMLPSMKKSPNSQYGSPTDRINHIPIEIVGHTFEPYREDGILSYNPQGSERFRKAFQDCFRALEEIRS